MRAALHVLIESARDERDWCDEHGRSTRAECFERIALEIASALEAQRPLSGLAGAR
jgi:hypothetical protein